MKTSARAWVIALCFPGAGLAQDTSVATAEPAPVLSATAAQANGHDDPAPQLAATQSLTTTSEDPGDAPAPVVLSANDEAEAAAPGAGTAEPPAGELADDRQGADAVRDDVATDPAQAGLEPAPTLSPEAARCREIAGPADAGVPANAESAARRRAAIAEAAEACTAAARADDAPADVLFLAAEVAQARRDLPAAFTLLERAADAGLAAAVTRLGDYHLFGVAPGGEDTEAAIAHFQRAAGMGDPAGMTTLAMMYRVGKGVPRDPARMVDLLQTAADAGYHFAQYRLGQTLLTGEGIPNRADADLGIPDPVRGAALYTAAARAGNVTAALELAALYGDPASGLEDNPKARAQLTSLASRSGLPEAIAAMAVLYETGDGVEYDPNVAAQLYVRALESGKVAFETLRQGAPGGWDRETALAFQAILRERGLYTGALDGIVGSGTAAAARGLSPG